MTINVSTLGGGSGAGFKLAPDLNYISSNAQTNLPIKTVQFDPSSGLTTALSLNGKFAIGAIGLADIISENFTVRLTIDGVVIIDDTFLASSAGVSILGENSNTSLGLQRGVGIPVICEFSLLLEVQSTSDNSVKLEYIARPIL